MSKRYEFIEEHRLKPLESIFSKTEMLAGKLGRSTSIRCHGWTINSHMQLRFGDGEFYRFKLIEEWGDSAYSHMSDDGYYYDLSWFEDDSEIPILDRLSEEDFLL